jgi:hypothetical protein
MLEKLERLNERLGWPSSPACRPKRRFSSPSWRRDGYLKELPRRDFFKRHWFQAQSHNDERRARLGDAGYVSSRTYSWGRLR